MFYVGKHRTKNLDDGYLGSGTLFNRAVRKYGRKNFVREILHYCNSEEELDDKEKEIINLELLENKNCYNIALGGQGSWHHVSQFNKGKTKLNSSGRLSQSLKITGENNPSKRAEVRAILKETSSGSKNGMFKRYGEKSPVSKLSNEERLLILIHYECGMTRKELTEQWKHKISGASIAKITQFKENNINKLCGPWAKYYEFKE